MNARVCAINIFTFVSFWLLPCADARLRWKNESVFQHPKLNRGETSDDPNGDQDVIESEYILVLDDSVDDIDGAVQSIADETGASVKYTFNHVFKGAALTNMQWGPMKSILDGRNIKYATPNKRMSLFGGEQSNPTWGLDRIDQQSFPLDDTFRYEHDGTGVTVFILDTGIRTSHSEFQGRASCGFTVIEGSNDCNDVLGHGTHVAGTVAGQTYGVAKNATLVAVQVMDEEGRGSGSDVLAGIEYVIQQKKNNPTVPMVLNMSIGSRRSQSLNDAVNAAVDAGVVVVTSAGNNNRNSCNASPGSAAKVITVGATDNGGLFYYADRRARYSNVGSCIDIFAPGTYITSAGVDSDDDTATYSGTSMASPHVAGAAALYLSRDPTMTPAAVSEEMKADATSGTINWFFSRRSPNLLLNIANV